MYPYHGMIRHRINNGELTGIVPSDNSEFAFVLIFSTFPYRRPIRHHAVCKYEDVIQKFVG